MPNGGIVSNGNQIWRTGLGVPHRTDGPAVILSSGEKQWRVNGKLHRLDGPAVIRADGRQEWIINDTYVTKEVNEWMNKQNVSWPWDGETHAQFLLTFG